MGLRELAESDLATIVEDRDHGFGYNITLKNPSGTTLPLIGLSSDIAVMINPETGQAVSGRHAHVAIRLTTLRAAPIGFGFPSAVREETSKPWIVEFTSIDLVLHKFKVYDVNVDRALGLVILVLEKYL